MFVTVGIGGVIVFTGWAMSKICASRRHARFSEQLPYPDTGSKIIRFPNSCSARVFYPCLPNGKYMRYMRPEAGKSDHKVLERAVFGFCLFVDEINQQELRFFFQMKSQKFQDPAHHPH